MTLTLKPQQQKKKQEFIDAAPDGAASQERRTRKVRKVQISLTLAPALLDRVDEMARRGGQSRAAFVTLALTRAVEHGVSLDGLGTADR